MVEIPQWKIWFRQLGVLFPKIYGKKMFQTTNQYYNYSQWDLSLIYPLWCVLFAKICKVGELSSTISHRYIDTVTWFRVHFLKSKLANISVITMVYGRYDLTTSWGIILDSWQLTRKKWKWTIASLLTFIQLLCISFDFVPWYVDEQRDSMSLLGMGGDAKNHIFCPTKHLGKLRKSYLTENLKEQKKTFLGHRGGRIITLKQIIVWMIFHASGQIKK